MALCKTVTIELSTSQICMQYSFILSLLSMCYIASIFHVLTRFRAATFMLQTFQTMSKVLLGRGSILSDAVGVDGLSLSSKPSTLIVLDGLKPYLL